MKRYSHYLIGLVFLVAVISLPASLTADMSSYLDGIKNNYQALAPTPQAYQGQERGYFMGGSGTVKFNFQDQPLVAFTPPKVKTGCGGIDIVWGGFSYLNFDYLVKKLQSIMQAAPAFAFQLALGVLCPDCKNILDSLDVLANMVNNLNFNSCQAAKSVVGFAGSQLELTVGNKQGEGSVNSWLSSMKNTLTNVGSSYKDFINDYAGCYDYYAGYTGPRTNMECGKKLGTVSFFIPFMRQVFNEVDTNSFPFEGVMRARYGDVYQIADFTSTDFASPVEADPGCEMPTQTIMDDLVTGVYVIKNTNSTTQTSGCSKVDDPDQGLLKKVTASLTKISDSISNGTVLDQADIDVINASRFPIYRFMYLCATYEFISGTSQQKYLSKGFVNAIAKPLAYDIAFETANHALTKVRNLSSAIKNAKTAIGPEKQDMVNDIPSKLTTDLQNLQAKRREAWAELKETMGDYFKREVEMQAAIHNELNRSKLMDSYRFAKGMR